MARRRYGDDEEDEDELADDPEAPDPSDYDDDEEPDIIPCPRCRKAVLEDAVRCHHCGEYLSQEDKGGTTSAVVVIIILVLVGLAVLGLLLGR
jgi:predicted nucleic acid-binding Zn ribbon protein